jgi:hypothetical protein
MGRYEGEPKLDEVLADPIVLAVMRSDGVDVGRYGAFLQSILRRRQPSPWSSQRALRTTALFEGTAVSSGDLAALRSRLGK